MPSYLVLTSLTDQTELLAAVAAHLPNSATTNHISAVNEHTTSPTIEQVRTLLNATHFSSEPTGRGITWLVWNIHTSSIPAQNALLKLLEEPPADTTLLVVSPSLEGVLPTIQSRCTILSATPTNPVTYASANLDQESIYQPAELYEQICKGTIPQLIGIADKLGSVETATITLKQLIGWLRYHPHFPTKAMAYHLQLVTAAHASLLANANPKLTLEHCFFGMRQV